ncbi:hypothetical protein [Candidatus Raskinella chloraquaticus]|jgi:hypothetical protein|uniref:Uncharacterized protein n=1 Tax=Candidatus Raskinella chloraquaticus TaxID=1951219 RepID=A0A1W9HRE4_9HYPH|nr:MAG: hypothetical protein A4S15_14015 [Proteobacteria bacterium SG_bin8]
MSVDHDLFTALERYGANSARWPPALLKVMEQTRATDPSFAAAWDDMTRLEGLIASSMEVPPAPIAYGSGMAARTLSLMGERRHRKVARLTLAFGGSWAVAAMIAGLVASQLLTTGESDVLAYAEMALGTTSLITGN